MTATINCTVTYLEMHARPANHVPTPAQKILLLKTEQMPVHYYRYLYDNVGRGLYWVERKQMSDEALSAAIHAEGTTIHVLYVGGVPAGYFELVPEPENTVALGYFGVIPDFHGRGLGKWLLAEAIAGAWDMGPARVTVETCTLDNPHALPLYQKLGFTPFARKEKTLALPKGFEPHM